MCGLIRRESLPEIDLGYALVPEFWGLGYAREAAEACVAWGRDTLGLRGLLATLLPSLGKLTDGKSVPLRIVIRPVNPPTAVSMARTLLQSRSRNWPISASNDGISSSLARKT